jgi:hypothetical protein
MSETDALVQAIRQRLEEAQQEIRKLEQAASALSPIGHVQSPGPTARSTKPRSAKRRRTGVAHKSRVGSRRRLAPAERKEQLLAVVRRRPGITLSDLGRESGLGAGRLGQLVRELEADRQLKRVDGGLLAS